LQAKVAKLRIGRAQRHLLLCAPHSKPKCCSEEEGAAVWAYVKARLTELGLEGPHAGAACVLRNRVDCLRICEDGPIAVVYPEGTWYRGVTIDVAERIITEHLVGGRPVEEYVFARAPLGKGQG
jgi:(2Fe-2S) ferredoxin